MARSPCPWNEERSSAVVVWVTWSGCGLDEPKLFAAIQIVQHVDDALRLVAGNRVIDGLAVATIKRRLSRAETTFLAGAERDPVLREWLAQGERWAK